MESGARSQSAKGECRGQKNMKICYIPIESKFERNSGVSFLLLNHQYYVWVLYKAVIRKAGTFGTNQNSQTFESDETLSTFKQYICRRWPKVALFLVGVSCQESLKSRRDTDSENLGIHFCWTLSSWFLINSQIEKDIDHMSKLKLWWATGLKHSTDILYGCHEKNVDRIIGKMRSTKWYKPENLNSLEWLYIIANTKSLSKNFKEFQNLFYVFWIQTNKI